MDTDFDIRLINKIRENRPVEAMVASVDVDHERADALDGREAFVDSPTAVSEDEERIVFEQIFFDPYELSYTCLLIPRFSSHFLMGDVSDNLRTWMQKICISFGWKLDFLIVKADFMEWAMHVPPTTSPAYFIQMVRHHLSTDIFAEHPRFKRENISDDFWAPGHIILVGSRPLPEDFVQRFIQTTRRQQA